jgi:hypothetical protein
MADHPYRRQPARAFWRQAVAELAPSAVDPVADWSLRIGRDTRVATAGSCFAQHIARRLAASGFCYLVTEPPHPLFDAALAARFNYGTFSARYGNVYTTRQLRQLLDRAFGDRAGYDEVWQDEAGHWIDPFRPGIQPDGFGSRRELELDREQHLRAVRRLFDELDVFVFTLGLTEAWVNAVSGAVYPVCPGVAGGQFDATKHSLHNFDVCEVAEDLEQVWQRLQLINPTAQMILTVSPVPLMATATADHVLTATTYSKSVLRVAADQLARRYQGIHYFPSFEIITGSPSRGSYFAPNLRDVTEAGVDHVMRVFFQHATGTDTGLPAASARAAAPHDDFVERAQRVVDTICEENLLDQAAGPSLGSG